uniref:Uncharacterized protein n=1 Tax=Panagrolaimus superbus TaxID=310955 RepID=A0A914YG47_9BILA
MRGDPATLHGGNAAGDLHAVAVGVGPGINGAVGQLQARLVAGQPASGKAVAHVERCIAGGQLAPVVDVHAIAANGVEAAAVDHRAGIGLADAAAEQAHAATYGVRFHVVQQHAAAAADVEPAAVHVGVVQLGAAARAIDRDAGEDATGRQGDPAVADRQQAGAFGAQARATVGAHLQGIQMHLTALAGGAGQGADAAGHRNAASGVADHTTVGCLHAGITAAVAGGIDVDIAA